MNEEEVIEHTIETIQSKELPETEIFVLDRSEDRTPAIIEELAGKYGNITLVPRPRPELGEAIKLGISTALTKEPDFDYVITMDSDMSHHPDCIPTLLEKGEEGYGMVIGSRYVRGGGIIGWSLRRKITSWGANRLARTILGVKTLDNTTNFRCFSNEAATTILPLLYTSGYGIFPEISFRAQKAGFEITEIPIVFKDRELGESKLVGGEYFRFLRMLWNIRRGKL